MALFSRRRRMLPGAARRRHGEGRAEQARARAATLAHFRTFVSTRAGVEGYLEPATAHDPHTLVLVARTGEWTRRRVPDLKAARQIGRELAIPVYDVHVTGYPARMRAWTSAQRRR